LNYSSIENHYRTKFIDQVRLIGADKLEWVALEKLDGSNLSLWPEDGSVKIASRSQFTDGGFYGCGPVVEPLFSAVLSIGKVVYGEIYGQSIQKRINYGEKKFAAFDISDGDSYVSYDTFVSLCDTHAIPRCPEIARGSFDDLLEMSAERPSFFGSPIAEGFVMKPVCDIRLPSGSRVILKKKSDAFKEKEDKPVAKEKKVATLSEEDQILLDSALPYINENRVVATISKGYETFPEVASFLLADVAEDMAKDGLPNDLSKVKSGLMSKAGPIIRKMLFS
jgi:Rnl2 family RNA ligase